MCVRVCVGDERGEGGEGANRMHAYSLNAEFRCFMHHYTLHRQPDAYIYSMHLDLGATARGGGNTQNNVNTPTKHHRF